ncbi:DUF58 domain-containing protein [Actinomyces wuliandei]|uniref:DUF58 domain-containing protein n=1 Tax=Actinomyces wuliandei TaxID=2057743 RepID=UPI000FD800E8|nr:DUF58 domain-containing protein [Actinomyces wuliandei]
MTSVQQEQQETSPQQDPGPAPPSPRPGSARQGGRAQRLRAALSLPTLRRATGMLDGRHKSVFLGHGQDFDDMSFYRPGDDVSDIDWKSSARVGYPVIKRYQRESSVPLVLAVDTGRTMAAQTPHGDDKRDLVLGVAEVFSYLARMRGDPVGLVAGDSRRMVSRPARSGAKHAQTLLAVLSRALWSLDAQQDTGRDAGRTKDVTAWGSSRPRSFPGTPGLAADAPASSLPVVLERVSRWHRRRSLVVLVTDTAHPGEDCAVWLRRLPAQHELVVVQVADDDPLREGAGRAHDVDSVAELPAFLRSDPRVAAEVGQAALARRQAVASLLERRHIESGVVDCGQTLIESVAELLMRERAAVARGRR